MEFLTGFALACLLLIFVLIGRDFGRLAVTKIFLALLVAAGGFLLHPLVPRNYQWITIDLQVLVPALFWLLCQFAFTDRPKLKSVWAVCALYSATAPSIARAIWHRDSVGGVIQFFGWTLGESFEYLILLNALWVIVSNWSGDLVESRRKLRVAMLVIVGFAVSSAVISLNFRLAGEYTRAIIVSITGFVVAFFLLRGRVGVLYGDLTNGRVALPNQVSETEQKEPAVPMRSDALIKLDEIVVLKEEEIRLKAAMEEGFYKTENLTLKLLAKKIDLPEYRARNLINQTLGYRNFNDYINQLRIGDAAQCLLDDHSVPILNISLDVGYRSISSFNRAFKDIKGVSPTLYRQQATEKVT